VEFGLVFAHMNGSLPSEMPRRAGQVPVLLVRSSPLADTRVLSTIWAVLPSLTLGLAAPFTFAYAAIRLRSRWLGRCAVAYGVCALSSFYLAVDPPGASTRSADLGLAIAVVTMTVSTVHGFFVRPRLLHMDETQTEALAFAKRRILRRARARDIVATNPRLADELRIGRPDLPRRFDDGGLVDVNHVPVSVLAQVPGVGPSVADQIVSTREEVGGFRSVDDLSVTLGIPPQELDPAAETLIFRR
jgi:hypothetical protein